MAKRMLKNRKKKDNSAKDVTDSAQGCLSGSSLVWPFQIYQDCSCGQQGGMLHPAGRKIPGRMG